MKYCAMCGSPLEAWTITDLQTSEYLQLNKTAWVNVTSLEDGSLFFTDYLTRLSGKLVISSLCSHCHQNPGKEQIHKIVNPEPIESRFEILDL